MVPHLLLFLLLSTSSLSGIESAATLKLTNHCGDTIWPEILPAATAPDLPALPPGKSKTIPVPTPWSGRIWGRTHCGTSPADCGARTLDGVNTPATVVELALDGAGGLDYSYGVSSVDGEDIPVVVLPKKAGTTRSVDPRSDELKETAARGKGSVGGEVASNDTSSSTTHTDYVIVFCPSPYPSKEVLGRRRDKGALPLVNKTTTWPSKNPNAAFSSPAVIGFTGSPTTSNPDDHQESNEYGGDDETMMTMEPVKTLEMRMMLNDKRRRLNSFQMCALCTCCSGGGSRHYCLLSPCCYAINCNIPNKPFGFCSFTPKACNCFGCSS